ncbi:VOC family protein [Crystallibacter degradans]|uniref:VOC family protein n=1 Tax=Crystallibacter degradans TaxID=2726743 RepID=UPI003211E722
MPRIVLANVYVDDQAKALAFYTDVLGFVLKTDQPAGEYRWLTVVSAEAPDGVELLLEPDANPAIKVFKEALVADGIAFTSFAVEDVAAAYEQLSLRGIRFTQPPAQVGTCVMAVLDDTCGNLIEICSTIPQ